MIINYPTAGDIVNASATATTSSLVTIPAGRWLSADIQMSASGAALGSPATPRVTYNAPGGATGSAPANGAVLCRLSLGASVSLGFQSDATTEILVYGGTAGGPGCTLDFNSGGASNVSVTINGFLI